MLGLVRASFHTSSRYLGAIGGANDDANTSHPNHTPISVKINGGLTGHDNNHTRPNNGHNNELNTNIGVSISQHPSTSHAN